MVVVAEHIKVPELRFPEFSGEWEEKRLGGIFSFKNGMTISASQYGGDVAFINVSQILQSKAIKSSDAEKHVNIDSTSISDFLLQEGDFLFQRSSETREDVGSSNFFIGSGIAVYSGFVIRGRPKIMNAATFIAASLKQHKTRHSISRLSGGSTRYNIGQESLAGVHLRLPSIPEQQKIAEFLTAVDEKIGKLKRKKELLEAYKKGAMQKLFSQEIRFKDDQGNPYPDWEEKRLGEVTSKTGKRNKSGLDLPIYSINNKIGFNPQADEFDGLDSNERGYDTTAYKIIEKNTFAYNPARINVGSIGFSGELSGIIISSLYVCFQTSSELSDEFVWYFFRGNSFHQEVLRKSEGGVRMYLFYENFSSIRLAYPTLPEQQKIAEFLMGIDDKIKVVANQIDKAAEFKKGLLQKMFV